MNANPSQTFPKIEEEGKVLTHSMRPVFSDIKKPDKGIIRKCHS